MSGTFSKFFVILTVITASGMAACFAADERFSIQGSEFTETLTMRKGLKAVGNGKCFAGIHFNGKNIYRSALRFKIENNQTLAEKLKTRNIVRAEIRLRVSCTSESPKNATYNLHRLRRKFEATSFKKDDPALKPAWQYYQLTPDKKWSKPGADDIQSDRYGEIDASFATTTFQKGQSITIDVTQYVKDIIAGGKDYGWLIKAADESAGNNGTVISFPSPRLDIYLSEGGISVVKADVREYFFDMGHPDNPILPGATGIGADTPYSAMRGYGWMLDESITVSETDGKLIHRTIRLVRGHLTPDDLTGDGVLWRGGEKPLFFRTDIPNGKYVVTVWIGASQNTRSFSTLADYSITANDKKVAEFNCTRGELRRMLFREYDNSYEWTPGADIWAKYIKDQRVRLYQFPVEVIDGKLIIGFNMAADGDYLKTGVEKPQILPINAVMIIPAEKENTLPAKLAAIDAERKKQFDIQTVLCAAEEKNALPEIPSQYKQAGYVPFARNFCANLYHNSIPLAAEIAKPLSISVARGERGISRFAIRPFTDLKGVTLEISDLSNDVGEKLPKTCVSWNWLRYIERPMDVRRRSTGDYRPVADLLMPAGPSDAAKDFNRQFVVEIISPVDAPAGKYHGTVRIKPANAPTVKVQLEVTIYPFTLETYANDDERTQIYDPGRFLTYYGSFGFTDEDVWKYIQQDMALMKKYSFAPTVLFTWFVPMDRIDRFMEIYTKQGFHGYAVFGGYELLHRLEDVYQKKAERFDIEPFFEVIQNMMARQKEKKWPEFLFYCTAEIYSAAAYPKAKEIVNTLKAKFQDAKLLVLTNRTEELNVLYNSAADVVAPNAVSMTEDALKKIAAEKKKLWFYGWGRERFRCGLVDWRIKNRGGLSEWYSYVSEAPFNPFDGKFQDAWNDAPPYLGPDGPIPTLFWETCSAGRIDFLYLATLEQWLARAQARKDAASIAACEKAQAILDDLNEMIVPDYSYYYKRIKAAMSGMSSMDLPRKKIFGFADGDYDVLRERIANSICELKNVCK